MSHDHTPGPWRWRVDRTGKRVKLVSLAPRPWQGESVIEFTRWGMGGATIMLMDRVADGPDLLKKLHVRDGWIVPIPGREHHAKWCAQVTHPDARLIEAAPDLLTALQGLLEDRNGETVEAAGRAVARALGQERMAQP